MPQKEYSDPSQTHKFKRDRDASPDVDLRPLPPQPQPTPVGPKRMDFDDEVMPPLRGQSRSRDDHPNHERSRS
eukprot:12932363-Prorocentrum_lima.AAC.1